ncbi:MAG: hypothetical protein ACI9U2_002519 [Bradymonadia bacterium]|jgi:hypothetical protein
MRSRTLVGLALAAVGLIFGLRAWQASSRAITVRYEAPAGDLSVTIIDDAGARLRRVDFGSGVERQHALRLPDGDYRARLKFDGRTASRPFTVREDAAFLIDWR